MKHTFFLKEPNSTKETLILFTCYFKEERKKFVYSTGEFIKPTYWNKSTKSPFASGAKKSRGRTSPPGMLGHPRHVSSPSTSLAHPQLIPSASPTHPSSSPGHPQRIPSASQRIPRTSPAHPRHIPRFLGHLNQEPNHKITTQFTHATQISFRVTQTATERPKQHITHKFLQSRS